MPPIKIEGLGLHPYGLVVEPNKYMPALPTKQSPGIRARENVDYRTNTHIRQWGSPLYVSYGACLFTYFG